MQFLLILVAMVFGRHVAAAESCGDCVGSGCVYCKGNDFFDNQSVCVCSDYQSGFFGGCSDHSFGSKPLKNSVDCGFGNAQGELILTVILLVLACCCCGGISYTLTMRRQSSPTSAVAAPTNTENRRETFQEMEIDLEEEMEIGLQDDSKKKQPIPTAQAILVDNNRGIDSGKYGAHEGPIESAVAASAPYMAAPGSSAAHRLAYLEAIKHMMTQREYDDKRAEILAAV